MADPIQTLRMRNRFRDINLADPNFPQLEPQTREMPIPPIPTIATPTSADILRSTIQRMPSPEEHRPSTLRRIGGVIGGALAGAAGRTEVGKDFVEAPFRRAQEDWLTDYKRVKGGYDLDVELEKRRKDEEDKIFNQGIKERETVVGERGAGANETNAAANMLRATKEPTVEQARQLKEDEWNAELQRAVAGDEASMARVLYQQEQLNERQKSALENARSIADDNRKAAWARAELAAKTRRETSSGGGGKISPTQQESADRLAVNKVLQKNPQFEKYVKRNNSTGRIVEFRDTNDEEYKNFLNLIDSESRKILKRGGAVSEEGLIEGDEFEAEELED